MKIKDSIFTFVFGAFCSGGLVSLWVAGSIGIIDVGNTNKPLGILYLIISASLLLIMLFKIIIRPEIVKFEEGIITLRSISLIPRYISFPIDNVKKVEAVKIILDGENQGIRLYLDLNDLKIGKLKESFKSCDDFGFKQECFEMMIWGSEKRAHKISSIINSKLSSG